MSDPIKITRQTLARAAAEKWGRQYGHTIAKGLDADKAAIWKALVALGPDPEPDTIDAIIGNRSWTAVPKCSGCGRDGLDAAVQVGEEPDYESSTAHLCGDCLRLATIVLNHD